MSRITSIVRQFIQAGLILSLFALVACSEFSQSNPPAPAEVTITPDYIIGPRDGLSIFVWQNPDLSTSVTVRPDGRISIPLVDDMQAASKTPSALARDIEKGLTQYVVDPLVTVSVTNFIGPYSEQIRIVGQALKPSAIAYNTRMTVLDAMIAVGGMTEFASGNESVIVRYDGDKQSSFSVRLDDLLLDGDVSANVPLLPGDIIIIPESWF